MKKNLFYGLILILLIMVAGCNDSKGHSKEATKKETTDKSELTEQQEKEFNELEEGLPRDTAEFLLKEFGETANIDSTLVADDYYILDKREIDGKLMRFYKSPSHLVTEISRFDDNDHEINGLSVTLLGDIEKDPETTYIERLKDTKKVLDFLFEYGNQKYDVHEVQWSYPIKSIASDEQYSGIDNIIIADGITREQYEKEWETIDFENINMNEIHDMDSASIVDNLSLIPFTDRLDRHDEFGKTYEVNGLSVTLKEAERLDEYGGVSIEDFCATEDRECNSFIKTKFVIKNDRDYDMTGFSTFIFDLGWTMDDGQTQSTEPMLDSANGFEFSNLQYEILVRSGEEKEFEIVFADYNDVEHQTINFNNYVFDSVGADTELVGPVDQQLNLSWLLDDIF